MQAQSCLWKRFTKFQSKVVHNSKHFLLVTCSRLSFNQKRSKPNKKVLKSIEMTSSVELPKLPENQKSYAGIPEAVFVDDVDQYMSLPENNSVAEKVLKSLDEQHSKYKFMEMNMVARKRRLRQQIPDLVKSLEMIKILNDQKEDLETNILLSEQVFIKSVIPPTKTVCLWLGANVMLEYPLDEAETLLKQNMESASTNLRCLEHDQEFLRDQLTTTEVSMARIYNWDITRRKNTTAVAQK